MVQCYVTAGLSPLQVADAPVVCSSWSLSGLWLRQNLSAPQHLFSPPKQNSSPAQGWGKQEFCNESPSQGLSGLGIGREEAINSQDAMGGRIHNTAIENRVWRGRGQICKSSSESPAGQPGDQCAPLQHSRWFCLHYQARICSRRAQSSAPET